MKTFKKIASSFILVCLLSITSKAQSWEWATKAGGTESDYANSIDVDDYGNSYVTGTFYNAISFGLTTLTNPGLWSVYIAKYDGDGNLLWAQIAASDFSISVGGISVGKSGNISIAGQFSGSGNFGTTNPITLVSTGDYDVFVATYDNTGEIKWAQSSGGVGIDYAGGISTDKDGNVFITGDFHTSGFPASSSKIFIAKYDSTGYSPWFILSQAYGNFDYGMGIKTDTNGNSYITGEFFGTLIFDSSFVLDSGNPECNIFLVKFDAGGNVIWAQKAGGASGYAGAEAIDVDDKGNAYITGFYRGTISFGGLSLSGPSDLSYDVFIAKCNLAGNFEWVIKASGPGVLDEGRSISVDKAGNCFVTGYFTYTFTLGSTSLINYGAKDIFIAKANASGDFVWATQCGGLSDDNIGGIKANSQGVYLTGNFMGDINFGASLFLTADSSSKHDIFLAKINGASGIGGEGNFHPGVSVFPNPAPDEIQLKGFVGEMKYLIYDVSGKVVGQGITSGTNKIPVENLTPGIYFIQLGAIDDSRKSNRIKFIKN